MACPRCDGTLETYSLGGREAVICRHCGYVGIEADHRPEATEVETWSEALTRFRDGEGDGDGDGDGERGGSDGDGDGDGDNDTESTTNGESPPED